MKNKYKKFAALAILGIASSTWVLSAYAAWSDALPSTVDLFHNPTSRASLTAGDGDVITTDKWNSLAQIAVGAWSILTDYGRGKTYFVNARKDSEWRPVVTEINLPSSSSFVGWSNGRAGAIHFKDPTKSYNDGSGYKGGILWNESTNTIDLASAGGVRITNFGGTGDLIGWERVSSTDTNLFDTACQYRINATNGVIYPTQSNLSKLSYIGDGNLENTQYDPTQIVLQADTKNTLREYGTTWGPYVGNTSQGSFVSLEKLCLPSYN